MIDINLIRNNKELVKENKNIPTKIKNVQNIRQTESGKTHTVLRDGNNNVFVTGTNTEGQLGIVITTIVIMKMKQLNQVVVIAITLIIIIIIPK